MSFLQPASTQPEPQHTASAPQPVAWQPTSTLVGAGAQEAQSAWDMAAMNLPTAPEEQLSALMAALRPSADREGLEKSLRQGAQPGAQASAGAAQGTEPPQGLPVAGALMEAPEGRGAAQPCTCTLSQKASQEPSLQPEGAGGGGGGG